MDTQLIHAYTPLIFWTGLGLVLWRWLPQWVPQGLGRSLYWVGIPVEIFSLTRHTTFSGEAGIAPVSAFLAVLLGLGLGVLTLLGINLGRSPQDPPPVSPPEDVPDLESGAIGAAPLPWYQTPTVQGSLLLTSMLGNTGFVGLAIVPLFLDPAYGGLPAFYTVTQNILGTYGMGVLVASYCSDRPSSRYWWAQLKDLVTVPTLWAFALGASTQQIAIPTVVDETLSASIWIVIPCAFVLMGIRLAGMGDWRQLKLALFPVLIKMLAVPVIIGAGLTVLQVPAQIRLAMVLMSGMPSAFATLILAEEYDLDRSVAAGAIALSTVFLLVMLPLWIGLLA